MFSSRNKLFNDNHYKVILSVCLPLMLSLSATTVMEFTDRIFLANYSTEAISAALPAGITSFLFMAFFGGVGGYCGVFIAQYTGRGDHKQVGRVLWQGIYITLLSTVVFILLALYGTKPLFELIGHSPEIRQLEELYFFILCLGAPFHVAMATLATFFTGRGLTRPVMIITFLAVLINIPLDYGLIFGHWGLPELGIKGAALATVCAWGINVFSLLILIFTPKNNTRFQLLSDRSFDPSIFRRLLRFGVPGSIQFTIDILAFTIFILLVGRLGKTELAATNIVLSINSLAFMPSMGVSQGVSILVGQSLGMKKHELAKKYITKSCILLFGYILAIDLVFIFLPNWALSPFFMHGEEVMQKEIYAYCTTLLTIVSAYLFFDALYMVLSGALKGAGDTKFMMIAVSLISIICLIVPVYLGVEFFHISLIIAWLWVLLFITVLSFVIYYRYHTGIWQHMLVIEEE